MNRKLWIDLVRGFCMLAILLFHTEIYYTGSEIIPYNFYVQNSLTAFFFVSGYLFCPKDGFSLRGKVVSVARGLLVPYFIFTFPICIAKPLVNGGGLDMAAILADELTGHASWFIAALIVADILFAFIVKVSRGRQAMIAALSLLSLLMCCLFGNMYSQGVYYEQNLWHVNEALLAVFFIWLGYLYRCNENRADSLFTGVTAVVGLAVLVALKYVEYAADMKMVVGPVVVSHFHVLLIDCMVFIFLLVGVAKKIPHIRYVEFVGRNSLYFYFFCGASPTLVSILMRRILPYDGSYLTVIPAFVLVCLLCSAITYAVVRCKKAIVSLL